MCVKQHINVCEVKTWKMAPKKTSMAEKKGRVVKSRKSHLAQHITLNI